ncbi:MAG: GGDEF and EAL domain-containing protein [Sulfuricurvum sp.]|jgi:diguanylate cyclase (GGDEF)-like protein|uniref:EAL domain-containing protein n=1 Tax=Sulfuricurvum sp. TaxID=2025608 RepID=UPI0025E006EB|nr:EAL domain-containing protein [Sulfuricurvum sp.]MCK9372330.1 GGDEF and EAL domain-containing protein [Sulfuricurvum sp.]
MDYIFFVYGLAFILLGVVSLILYNEKSSLISWIWLAAFGFLHGLNEWMDMFKLLSLDNPIFEWIGQGTLVGSFFALIFFGKKLVSRKKFIYFSTLMGGIFLFYLWQYPDDFFQLLRYVFGFTGALFSALLLWHYAKRMKYIQLKFAAVGMGLYAIAAGLIVPVGTIPLSLIMNYETFLEVLGFPVQVLRLLSALMIVIGVWTYYLNHRHNENETKALIYPMEARKLFFIFGFVTLGGFFLVNYMGERREALMVKELLARTTVVSRAIDIDAVRSLQCDTSDIGNPSYEQLKIWLSTVNVASRFAYMLTIRHGMVHFLVDSEKLGSSDYSPPGQHYEETSADFFNALQKNKPFIIGPETDHWGRWITVVVPLGGLLSDGGNVYFAFDIDYDSWKNEIAGTRQLAMAILFLISTLMIYFFAASNKIIQINTMLNTERNLFIGGPAIIIKWKIFDERWRVIYVSANIYGHLSLKEEEMRSSRTSFLEQIHPDDQILFISGLEKLRKSLPEFEEEIRVRHADGSYRWFHVFVIRQTDRSGEWFQGYFTEISSRKEAEESAVYLATHDVLTGFPKTLLLEELFLKSIATAKRNGDKVALMYLDIDRFNRINETFGHAFGNDLILAISKRLKNLLREMDSIAREGGDEFVILIPMLEKKEKVSGIAEKILREISRPFTLKNESITLSCSIGIAVFPDDGEGIGILMQQADTALMEAKNSGRSTYAFSSKSANEKIAQRLMIENQLHFALLNGELSLHYQPQIDVESEKVVGVEALLRWNNPLLGSVSPAVFIPIAEECGLIVPIGEWVLEEACRQNKEWESIGFEPIVMAVNMSYIQLKRPDFIATLRGILERTSLEAAYLELELTESTLADDNVNIITKLQEIRDLGVAISIDDFGTGYSNFLYLKKFNVSKLKIDQSFIFTLEGEDGESRAIVNTMIQFAKTLQLTTIAEGVEKRGQFDILEACGCDEIQGYYFSRPLPPQEFVTYFKIKRTE